jgi:thiol-disulfide isomerase/thioredoxin
MAQFCIFTVVNSVKKTDFLMELLSRFILLLFVIGIIVACGAEKKDQQPPMSNADYVEQSSFKTLQGDSIDISDFEGKVVMIDFWETWCKPCLASFSGIDSLKSKYPDDFEVLAVTPGFTDNKNDAKTFAENHNYNFTYAMDSNNLHQKLGVQGIPFKVFVDANGMYISSSLGSLGPDGDYDKIKNIIENHKNSVGKKQ